MKLSITRLYEATRPIVCSPETEEIISNKMSFDISADGVTNMEELDKVIRQLQQLRIEIAGGCMEGIASNDAISVKIVR